MATRNQALDVNWVDVKSSLSLVDDQRYTFENTGGFTVRIIEAATVPEANTHGHQLDLNDKLSVTPALGLNIYVRIVQKNFKGNLTVTEAV